MWDPRGTLRIEEFVGGPVKYWDENGILRCDEKPGGPNKHWDSEGRLVFWEHSESSGYCFIRTPSGWPCIVIR